MRGFAASILVFSFLLFILPLSNALGCNPGTSECSSETAYHVCNEFALWNESVDCTAGWSCFDGACQAPIGCKTGIRECISMTAYHVCGEHGIWNAEESCPTGQTCSSGQCIGPTPQCSMPGQTRCSLDSSNVVQVCNANLQWEALKTCSSGCSNGYCRDCTPGASRCNDGTHYQACDSSGNWGSSNYCGDNKICDGGSCILNPAINCRDIGTFRCSPNDATTLQRCGNNYQWADFQYCQLGCFYSACRACGTGQTKCKDSGSYYICTNQGQWGMQTDCPNGYFCFSGSCQVAPGTQCNTVGERRCSPSDPNELQMCNNNKVFVNYLPCAKGCFNGQCAECTPGASVCSSATTYKICTQNGQLSDDKICAVGTTCEDGACVATPKCTDGQRQCVSGAVYACTSNDWKLLYICPQNNDCKEEQGTAYCVPEPQANVTPKPAPVPPIPEPQRVDSPLGTLGVIFVGATLVFGAVAFYFYTRMRKN